MLLNIFKRRFSSLISIIAHIDAGKTTTTERMIYYSGLTRHIGEVDSGDTVMDYLPEERNRGITITSAAITFGWKGYKFNLIDTPGHVDFTMEVERCMRVLDGAVTILDAVAGVQAQTVNVWKQADKYRVPKLVYINKMDRVGANFEASVNSVRQTLGAKSVCTQYPLFEGDKFKSVVHLVNKKVVSYSGGNGEIVSSHPWHGDDNERLWYNMRNTMIETLVENDEDLFNVFVERELTIKEIKSSLRKLVLQGKICPILCGSSYKNIGVQGLMDGIVDYLPCPLDVSLPLVKRNEEMIELPLSDKGSMIALAFKVVNHQSKGILVFIRVYSGVLKPGMTINNSNRNTKERIQKLYQVYGNDFEELPFCSAGNIAVILGCKSTRTGDTLIEERAEKVILDGITTPQSVISQSVEPETNADEKALEHSLSILMLEDPSCSVVKRKETGQTLIAGMGELHLEILRLRLLKDFKVKANFGDVRIAYKESLIPDVLEVSSLIKKAIANNNIYAEIGIKLLKTKDETSTVEIPSSVLLDAFDYQDKIPENRKLQFPKSLVNVLKESLSSLIQVGPILGYPLTNCKIVVTNLKLDPLSTENDSAIRMAIMDLSSRLNRKAFTFEEPLMHLEVIVPSKYLKQTIHALTVERSACIIQVEQLDDSNPALIWQRVTADAPLDSLLNYSTQLRSLTAGMGSFEMKLKGYRPVSKCKYDLLMKQFFGDQYETAYL
ncbi:Small GTP-binding protein domain-containing protein [Rozella allomycis CSF55]|uniref:Elongation factor 2 n=1 Tax=Rozella allomycis (strain CSF55) TaxID=988480 RepID=A0A075AY20_ROZAC|nr:Small GTP-binding protein domain-containing protein [Rozella allomycis CSF55]|eukprot:EPZ35210.1 Small GTP-binding protein domain-containing protein [Rozella allomycis CSF55]